MHKATLEKKAKELESTLDAQNITDNRSVLRALARAEAATVLHSDVPERDRLELLVDTFYKDAKWQPSWEDPLTKHNPLLAEVMKTKLGTPAPRVRVKADKVEPPATEDDDATLGSKPTEDKE